MHFLLTTIIGIDTRFELIGAQRPVCFRHGALAMDAFRFDGVEPWTFTGQLADHNSYAHGAVHHLSIVMANPVPHDVTAMPGGIVSDERQCREALARELRGTP